MKISFGYTKDPYPSGQIFKLEKRDKIGLHVS